jgi:hypothetical protein
MEMIENSILVYIILSASVAEFAMQMQLSVLATKVKGLLYLDQPHNSKLDILSNQLFWYKLLGIWFILLAPLILFIIFFFHFYKFLVELVNCPYCSCFWLSTAVNYFYFNENIITAMLFAPVSLIFVAILNKLHS